MKITKDKITISLDKKVLKRAKKEKQETGVAISRRIEDLLKKDMEID